MAETTATLRAPAARSSPHQMNQQKGKTLDAPAGDEALIGDFRRALDNIAALADTLNFPGWTRTFRAARRALDDETLPATERLARALQGSQVFGGMGSWLDSPPAVAYEQGLSATYDAATDALYTIRQRSLVFLRRNPQQ